MALEIGRRDVLEVTNAREIAGTGGMLFPSPLPRKCASCQIFAAVRLSCVARRDFAGRIRAHQRIEADYRAYNSAYLLLPGKKGRGR